MVKISCYKGVNENGIYTNTQKVLGLPYAWLQKIANIQLSLEGVAFLCVCYSHHLCRYVWRISSAHCTCICMVKCRPILCTD